ncbi:peroxiredoxin-like family protein [soil metagenome]
MTKTTIAEQISEFNVGFEQQIGPELAAVFAREQAALNSAGVPAAVVGVGDVLPVAHLVTSDGDPTTLTAVTGGRPAVVVFYRGAWCPYCNIALRTYERELFPALQKLGVGLIAISPQTPDGTRAIVQGAELSFPVLSDPANVLVRALGILTEPSAEARKAHTALGFDVADSNADGTGDIPLPTVIVIDAAGVARYVDIQVNYTSRTEVDAIVAAASEVSSPAGVTAA